MLKHNISLIRLLSDGEPHTISKISNHLNISYDVLNKDLNLLDSLGLKIIKSKNEVELNGGLIFLNKKNIFSCIDSNYQKKISQIKVFNEISSTNDYLLRNKKYHEIEKFTVFLAEYQSEGKGRLGKSWISPFGSSISLTIGSKVKAKVKDLATLPIEVGKAISSLINKEINLKIDIKPPNDLYFEGKKMGGVLVESAVKENDYLYLVIGLGINTKTNLEWLDKKIGNASIDLSSATKDLFHDRNFLVARLIEKLILTQENFLKI